MDELGYIHFNKDRYCLFRRSIFIGTMEWWTSGGVVKALILGLRGSELEALNSIPRGAFGGENC